MLGTLQQSRINAINIHTHLISFLRAILDIHFERDIHIKSDYMNLNNLESNIIPAYMNINLNLNLKEA